MVNYTIHTLSDHDKHIKTLNREIQKDEHWTYKASNESVIRSAVKKLGWHLFRIEKHGFDLNVVVAVQ